MTARRFSPALLPAAVLGAALFLAAYAATRRAVAHLIGVLK